MARLHLSRVRPRRAVYAACATDFHGRDALGTKAVSHASRKKRAREKGPERSLYVAVLVLFFLQKQCSYKTRRAHDHSRKTGHAALTHIVPAPNTPTHDQTAPNTPTPGQTHTTRPNTPSPGSWALPRQVDGSGVSRPGSRPRGADPLPPPTDISAIAPIPLRPTRSEIPDDLQPEALTSHRGCSRSGGSDSVISPARRGGSPGALQR